MQPYPIYTSLPVSYCQLTITDKQGEHRFSSSEIIRMQAADNYTIVHFNGRRPFVISKVLKIYDELLAPYGFVRTHRSHLVNKQFVKGITNNHVVMQDASVAELTRRKKSYIIRQLADCFKSGLSNNCS